MTQPQQPNSTVTLNSDLVSQLLRILPLLTGLGIVVSLFNNMQIQLTELKTRLDLNQTALAETVKEMKQDIKDIKVQQSQSTQRGADTNQRLRQLVPDR